MIATDTNVLLRYILRDDEKQFESASAFFNARDADDPAYISIVVLCELSWALGQRYGYSRAEIASALRALFDTEGMRIEDESALSTIITKAASSADIGDLMIAHCAKRSGCVATVTFDKKAASRIPGMELLA